ncbi:MAG: sigma-70 family RNA polymerase sigma factor [Nanoarchaeota archaeon]
MGSQSFERNGLENGYSFRPRASNGSVGTIEGRRYAEERDALTAKIADYDVRIVKSVSDGRPMSALAYCRWRNHYQHAFESCRNAFIEANIPLVLYTFARWIRRQGGISRGLNSDEILLDAHPTLVRAANLFNPAKGRFSTYCVPALLRTFDRKNKREERLMSRRTPLNETPDSSTCSPYQQAVDAEERTNRRMLVQRAFGCLSPQEMELISLRFGVNPGNQRLTHRQIGNSWGLAHQRAWQVERNALAKLRSEING